MYVDAHFDRNKDIIHVAERINGERVFRDYPPNYMFYYKDQRGKYDSIFGDKLSRYSTTNGKAFKKEKKMFGGQTLFESDVNQVFKCLENNYLGQEPPKLNTAFFDIEVDFNQELGFAPPEDPFNPVTAIAVNLNWIGKTICIACKPDTLSKEDAQEICERFPDTLLMDTEEDLLRTFLDLIEDADVMSGWNSEGFDIPYLVNRITRVLSKDETRRFCLWGQFPKRREFERYGKSQETFDTIGRLHLDYMQLYQKYTYHEMHSYALDAIGEYELNERKIAYSGTLDALYNNDFETFLDYNRQDVELLVKLDAKLQFIDLANVIAHDNTVLIQTTMGAVAVTDQAIINEAHRNGLIVPDKQHDKVQKHYPQATQAAGAYVATPVRGRHEWIGSMDLNSLYPSILRGLNLSTETIVGQVRHTLTVPLLQEHKWEAARAWEGKFAAPEYELVMAKDTETQLWIDFENGEELMATGAEIYQIIFESGQPWVISSNATIIKQDKKGIIPGLLERWYAERKILQTNAKEAKGVDDEKFTYWDKRQLVKKINLNSLYGALLNPGSRFNDPRMGQSTTLTGRTIARHMGAKVNELFTGEYDHVGASIIYGDTDSIYFSAYPIFKEQIDNGEFAWDKDKVSELYDTVCEQANETFPGYMANAHNVQDRKQGEIIAAAREMCALSGIFIKKKRYAILVYDNEGFREDYDGKQGKIKAMGLDLKRSDTPSFMQDFLSELLLKTLTGVPNDELIERIIEFRREFREKPAWEIGTPKRVNKLTYYNNLEWDKKGSYKGKANMPGHVRAAINYNRLRDINSDKFSLGIIDGMKTIVCKLKPNPMGFTSIGYPTDEGRIPDWFKELPFDTDIMEESIITKKIENLLGVIDIDLSKAEDKTTFESLFDFG
jgi:DNA polymerase elongation subunit (family B)|tara:strand:- start:3077 stop:5758 length:2682 start_codon:yes stop_codon:yes gene_type:complete